MGKQNIVKSLCMTLILNHYWLEKVNIERWSREPQKTLFSNYYQLEKVKMDFQERDLPTAKTELFLSMLEALQLIEKEIHNIAKSVRVAHLKKLVSGP